MAKNDAYNESIMCVDSRVQRKVVVQVQTFNTHDLN